MPSTFLQKVQKFEIQSFQQPKNVHELRKTHVPFTGSPQKHPYDSEKILLLTDPYSSNTSYFEFKTKDITYIQELPTIVNLDDEIITMVRVWVKKKSVGIRSAPFIIDDTYKG